MGTLATLSSHTFCSALRKSLVALLLLSGITTGCTPQMTPAEVQDLSKTAPSDSHSRIARFSEGTNMALTLSPDATQLVLSIQGTLFQLSSTGGSATPITDYYQDAREPQFSPDGQNVVYQGYAAGSWDIYQLHLADGTIQRLTEGPYDDREPVFSPDGKRIVFSSDRSGNYDLWQLDLPTNTLSQLTRSREDDYSPSFFGAQGEIAFVRHLQRDQSELRALNSSQGSGSRALLSEAGVISGVSGNAKSPHIAYQLLRRDRVGQAHTELKLYTGSGTPLTLTDKGADVFPFRAAWRQGQPHTLLATINGKIATLALTANGNVAGTGTVPFEASFKFDRTRYLRKKRDYSRASKQALGIVAPALSFDGQQMAFTALGDLWQWDFTNDELKQLTDDRFAEAMPSYSPNGKYIAYASDRGGSMQLWLHDLADGSQKRLDTKITGVSYPSWSPDGNYLAYFGALPDNPLGGQLMLADLATGSSKSIGVPAAPQPLSWSKDGNHLAAAVLAPYSRRYREGVYELLIFSLDGTETARLNLAPHKSPFDVRLTPDGQGVGFVQGGQLFYQPIDADFNTVGKPKRLSKELADSPAWSGDGRHVLALSGNSVRRFDLTAGTEQGPLTVPLDYARTHGTGRWTLRTSRVFNGTEKEYLTNLDIIINDNRIEALVKHSDSSPEPIVDVTDHVVIPGLFEMHAHMGNPSEAQGRIWLGYGITSVRDPGSNPYLTKERQEIWDSGRRPGPRTYMTGYLTDGERVFYPIAESLDADSLEYALRRTEALQLDFIKTYVRLSDSQQKRVVDFAHNLGIPTSSHELFPAAALGMDHVEHIGGTSRRGYQPKVTSLGYSYSDVTQILTQSGMGLTATAVLPAWAVIFSEDKDLFATRSFNGFYGQDALKGYAGFARRFGTGAKSYHRANSRLLRALTQRDALLVTGTDSPFVPYGTGLHAELRLYERAGLEPWQVLRSATAKSALACGVADELGTIAQGKLADLVVIDGDPLRTIKDADNVVLTVKGGQRFALDELLDPAQ